MGGYKVKAIKLKPNTEYTIHGTNNVNGLILISNNKQVNTRWFYDFRENTISSTQFTTDSTGRIYIGCYGVEDNEVNEILDNSTIQIEEGAIATPYKPYVGDTKQLLYYNPETQTWEKPILREWDSIEKHANGKYYYHQRSAEVVLNGSENWSISGHLNWSSAYCTDYINMQIADKGDTLICDRLTPHKLYDEMSRNDLMGITVTYDGYFGIKYLPNSDTKPTPSDVKQWLQANNVTVVYQLAEEKVYECTNIDLITYANETNYMVEAGAITPKTTLKVHNNISNVVSLLQKKVSVLESNITAMFRAVLAGDYQTLAYILYPGDFNNQE